MTRELRHRSDSFVDDTTLSDTDCVGYDVGVQSCSAEYVVLVTAGCEHEHVGPRRLCAAHAGDLRRGNHLCGDCLDHPTQPHRCVLQELG